MRALARVLMAAAGAEAQIWRDHAARRTGLIAVFAVFALIALILATALGVAALAVWLGPLAALGVALAVAILICLILLILLQLEARAHARRRIAMKAARKRMVTRALVDAVPAEIGNGSLVMAGLAVLALYVLGTPRDSDVSGVPDDDSPAP